MKRFFRVLAASAVILSFCGCISTVYRGKSFAPTSTIQILPLNGKLPENCHIIGSGTASGEFSAVTDAELLQKLKTSGMQHGARYMIVLGTRTVPDGKAANTGSEDFVTATADPDQWEFESSMNLDLDPPGSRQTYKRIMYADFLR